MDRIISAGGDGSKSDLLERLSSTGTIGPVVAPSSTPPLEVVTIADESRAGEFQSLIRRLRYGQSA